MPGEVSEGGERTSKISSRRRWRWREEDPLLVVSNDQRSIVDQFGLLDEPLEGDSASEESFGVFELLKERETKSDQLSKSRRV